MEDKRKDVEEPEEPQPEEPAADPVPTKEPAPAPGDPEQPGK